MPTVSAGTTHPQVDRIVQVYWQNYGDTEAALVNGIVYVLKFDRPVASRVQNGKTIEVNYYIGWTQNEFTLRPRMKHHMRGSGAALTRCAMQQKIGFKIIAVAPDYSRNDERRLKNWHKPAQVAAHLHKLGFAVNL